MGGVNLASPGVGDIGPDTAAKPFNGVGIEGPGLSSTVANSGMLANAPASFKAPVGGYSLYHRSYVIGNSTASCTFIGISYDNAGGSPFVVFEIGGGTSGSTSGMQINGNNAGSFTFTTAALPSLTAGKVVGLGAVWPFSNGNAFGYVNGQKTGSSGFFGTSGPTSSATAQVNLNTYSGTLTRFSNTVTFIALIYNRALSDAEMAQIDADPYSFLLSRVIQIPSSFVGVSGPPPSFLAAWARGSNIPVIGTGNY